MTHVFIGCDEIIGRKKLYFERLSALEVSGTFDDAVSTSGLDRWRTESPRGFAFTMVAHRAVTHPVEDTEKLPESLRGYDIGDLGLLRETDAVRAAWEHTLERAERLSPKLILLRTPMAFAPGGEREERLDWFARELAPMWRGMIAWEPHGLWEMERVIPLARELDLVPVFDPFDAAEFDDSRGTAYFALYQRRGLRIHFDEFDMERLIDHCEPYQRVIIIFRGGDKYRDARTAYDVWERDREWLE